MASNRWSATLRLRGAGGEPVNLPRTVLSHGLTQLVPLDPAEDGSRLTGTVELEPGKAVTFTLRAPAQDRARLTASRDALEPDGGARLKQIVRHMLGLDRDLSGFYERVGDDDELAWVRAGAGRMLRSPTVFEDVIKTICTTNCTWAATVRMVSGLVAQLGTPAPDAPPKGTAGRAFPGPATVAQAPPELFTDVLRCGYRGPYIRAIAAAVAGGELDMEPWGSASVEELPDQELERQLLALPGVGPYAAAHMMMLLGRTRPLVLDSWTRPKFAQLTGRRKASDATIRRHFRRYGPYAGLAFWLFLTRDWVTEAGWPRTAGQAV